MSHLYADRILQINLNEGKISIEPTSSWSKLFLGGRGINIKLLFDGITAGANPLAPASPLIFGAGPLCGTPVPAGRVEVTAKSPETGFLGTSNFGGFFGAEMKFAGYDNIVLTGKAEKPVYIEINDDRVQFKDATHLWGKDTYQTQKLLRDELGPDVKIACIGPAGEHCVHFATIQHDLGHGTGRTGMGAVLGSKNVKAIAIRGTKGVGIADPQKFIELTKKIRDTMLAHPSILDKQKRGVSFKQEMTALSRFKNQITRPTLSCDIFSKYESKIKRSGCFGCPTQCQDLYPTEAMGGGVVRCTFYISPFYPVRNNNVDVILEAAITAHRNGVDVVSSMNIIAWLMELQERGIITPIDTDGIDMDWGSREAILGILHKVINREGIGNILADGMVPAARKIGRGAEDFAYHIKGLPMYDVYIPAPENVIPEKGGALCLVMSSRGDTMKAFTFALEEGEIRNVGIMYEQAYGPEKAAEFTRKAREKVIKITGTEKAISPGAYEGKPEMVIYFEDVTTISDCLSVCKMCGSYLNYPFDENRQAEIFSAGSGFEITTEALFEAARRVKNTERAFCVREGMMRDSDVLPKKFMDYVIEKGGAKGEVLDTRRFEEMKSRYYALRGWDIETGIPTRLTLESSGLNDIAEALNVIGKLPR